jgi:hypothetical protein
MTELTTIIVGFMDCLPRHGPAAAVGLGGALSLSPALDPKRPFRA